MKLSQRMTTLDSGRKKAFSVLLAAPFVLGTAASLIVDSAVAGRITWSLYVAGGVFSPALCFGPFSWGAGTGVSWRWRL